MISEPMTKTVICCKLLSEVFKNKYGGLGASLVAQMVKNLPAMWETWV